MEGIAYAHVILFKLLTRFHQLMDFGYQYAMTLDSQKSFTEVLRCERIENPVSQRSRILEKIEIAEQAAANELF